MLYKIENKWYYLGQVDQIINNELLLLKSANEIATNYNILESQLIKVNLNIEPKKSKKQIIPVGLKSYDSFNKIIYFTSENFSTNLKNYLENTSDDAYLYGILLINSDLDLIVNQAIIVKKKIFQTDRDNSEIIKKRNIFDLKILDIDWVNNLYNIILDKSIEFNKTNKLFFNNIHNKISEIYLNKNNVFINQLTLTKIKTRINIIIYLDQILDVFLYDVLEIKDINSIYSFEINQFELNNNNNLNNSYQIVIDEKELEKNNIQYEKFTLLINNSNV